MIRSNAEEMVRKTMARFVDREVIPIAGELDDKGEFPEELFNLQVFANTSMTKTK